ncbi:MAG: ThuA domain-containing protein [Saprospiraceae bacterium]
MKNQLIIFLALACIIFGTSCTKETPKVLVFSKTAKFRHSAIKEGKTAIMKLGMENGFQVDTTENADYFQEEKLQQYAAVIFLNTTGDVLDYPQQAHFERYIQAGGGFVGIHAATDTEYDWKWYNDLVGAYFSGHPKIQEATLNRVNQEHPSTSFLETTWVKTDEWYNFKSINPAINVLLTLDESSYEGGTNGENHPMAWYHDYDGGQAFYTGLGHTKETYQNPLFLQHLLGGIQYAIGNNQRNYQLAHTAPVPEENRFVKEVLDFNLNEPMELDELPGRGLIFVERRGAIKLYDFEAATTKTITQLPVRYENEDGLMGIAVDPNYTKNNWIYLFYSVIDESDKEFGKQHISRFDLVGDSLLMASEKVLFDIPIIRKCCHSGGSLEFGKDGLLYIGVGDNTNPFESEGYAPMDERPNRALWDAQKSAANTNDLRGKILRIKPEADGTYSIPEGNLFPEGTANTRPEIYVMGCRNPFRFSIDSKTGFVYWGDVGPDAGKLDSLRGPAGMGEFDQARQAGFWGWPFTRGNNQAYGDHNFTTKKTGAKFNPAKLVNNSPHNTGLQNLPPAQESMIWFSYAASDEFPWLGDGGVNPMGGMVYHATDYPDAKQHFPDYFEDKLFVYEWMRDWVYVVTMDEDYNYVKAESFMPNTEFSHPMDMLFGSDGHLYVLEYGQKWNSRNMDARLDRIRYIEGNRQPVAVATADKIVGAAPLTVQFSAANSKDYDKEALEYAWFFTEETVQSTEAKPSFTFTEAGIYEVELTVTDPAGEEATTYQKIIVGNDPPTLDIVLEETDRFFYEGQKVDYKIVVKDAEDGSTENQGITSENVKVTLNYIPEGQDLVVAAIGHQQNTEPIGLKLINESDCKACHAINEKVAGPSYMDIATKYSRADENQLVSNIIKGSSGIWGETMMAAHPQLAIEDVEKIVNYILSLNPDKDKMAKDLPLTGVLDFKEHLQAASADGIYVLMASYLDKGNAEVEGSQLAAQEQFIFKPPVLQAEDADELSQGVNVWKRGRRVVVRGLRDNAFLKFKNLDLENLKTIKLAAYYTKGGRYKGNVEIREGSPTGTIIGTTAVENFNAQKSTRTIYDINLQSTTSKGDLFVVFKNEADAKQSVMNLDRVILGY